MEFAVLDYTVVASEITVIIRIAVHIYHHGPIGITCRVKLPRPGQVGTEHCPDPGRLGPNTARN